MSEESLSPVTSKGHTTEVVPTLVGSVLRSVASEDAGGRSPTAQDPSLTELQDAELHERPRASQSPPITIDLGKKASLLCRLLFLFFVTTM